MSLSIFGIPVQGKDGWDILATAVWRSPDSHASRYLPSLKTFQHKAPMLRESACSRSMLANFIPGSATKILRRRSSTFWRFPPVPKSLNEDENLPVVVPAMLYEVLSRRSESIFVSRTAIFFPNSRRARIYAIIG